MNQYLILLHPNPDTFDPEAATENQIELVGRHFAYLQRKLADGEVILVGRTQAKPYVGLCIFEAPDSDAAQAFLDADPAVVAGIFLGEVRPYQIALMRATPGIG